MPVGEKILDFFFRRQDTFFKGLRAAIQNWPKNFFNFFSDQKNFFFGHPDSAKLFLGPPPMPVGKKKNLDFFFPTSRHVF